VAGFIAKTVKIPAIVVRTGFGGAENAARTIYELEAPDWAGCHLEDQNFPNGADTLREIADTRQADMEEKSLRQWRRNAIKDFFY